MLRTVKAGNTAVIATLVASCLLGSRAAQAVTCSEQVTYLILHENGSIFFETNQTCPNWCELNFATAEQDDNGYAMLMAAKTQGISVDFDWPNISSCTAVNATYASPDFMYF